MELFALAVEKTRGASAQVEPPLMRLGAVLRREKVTGADPPEAESVHSLQQDATLGRRNSAQLGHWREI